MISLRFRPAFMLINTFMKRKLSSCDTYVGKMTKDNNIENIQEADDKTTMLPPPKTKSNEKKKYKVIKLQNGLTAMLISDVPLEEDGSEVSKTDPQENEGSSDDESDTSLDGGYENSSDDDDEDDDDDGSQHKPDIKLAAVGLCVGVGSFSDPKNIPGMAHFVEHMVFMGSKKYPDENEYDSYISKHGGCSNAHTDFAHTSFYFEIPKENLEEAIKRFSQFFISPLMKRDSLHKEREAVDSEFQIARSEDSHRFQQLLISLAVNNHPVKNFSWGNLKSLRDNVSDDELYDAAHTFHSRHYSAHRMTLVVQACLPVERLASWVLKYFSDVPNNQMPPDDFSPYYGAVSFQNSEFTKLYRVKSVREIYELKVTWAVPSLLDHWESKPHHYVASLLANEGKNSLMSYYRKKVWVLDITVGTEEEDFENNPMYTILGADLTLTEDGMDHLPEVLEAFFGYIQLMQQATPKESIFNEMKQIAEMSFEYSDEVDPYENVELLCANMHFYPSTDYLTGPVLYYRYDPQAIQHCLDHLTPDKANIMVFAIDKNGSFDKTEPWFGTEYSATDVPAEWLDMWKNVIPSPYFKLPDPNPFITTDFSLLPPPPNGPSPIKKLYKDDLCEIWYRQDTVFCNPIASYCYNLISPLARTSAENSVKLSLYCGLLKYHIAEEAYPAIEAELKYSIRCGERGLIITVDGFNQNLRLLLQTIVRHMKNFEKELDHSVFNAVKEDQKQAYYNHCMDPNKLSDDLRRSIVIGSHWTVVERYAACSQVTFEMLKEFSKDFLQHLYIQSLVQGNVSEDDAREACFDIINTLKFKPLLVNNIPHLRTYSIPKGEQYCRAMSLNTNLSTTYIVNYYQSGAGTLKDMCIIDFLMLLMEEPLFNTLRTQEKLGYDVSCCFRDTYGILAFSVTLNAHADKHSAPRTLSTVQSVPPESILTLDCLFKREGEMDYQTDIVCICCSCCHLQIHCADHVDSRIEEFMKSFLEFMKCMKSDEFEVVRAALINLKEQVDINLSEEVTRNWHEIQSETYIFDRQKREVEIIKTLTNNELIEWFIDHVSCGNLSNFRKLSVQVVGHVKEGNIDVVQNEDCTDTAVKHPKLHTAGSPRIIRKRETRAPTKIIKRTDINLEMVATSDNKSNENFITDIRKFQENLLLHPVHRILS